MDGGGRLDQPLMRSRSLANEARAGAQNDAPQPLHVTAAPRRCRRDRPAAFIATLAAYGRPVVCRAVRIARMPPPGLGIAASIVLLAATFGYGAAAGGHAGALAGWFKESRDAAADALGFQITAISVTGAKEVSREEILATAGVTGRASLLFFNAAAARRRLLANPWIADAAVLKLYPDRLQITITERGAFALWQMHGHVSVIAADGTILESFVEERFVALPLVVGRGAQRRAEDLLTIIDHYPEIRSALRASILVARRRWNLQLKNGIDVLLPETNVARALDLLIALDREKKLLSRDILAVDLRLRDRVTVRLSDAAAQARAPALKAEEKKKGGEA